MAIFANTKGKRCFFITTDMSGKREIKRVEVDPETLEPLETMKQRPQKTKPQPRFQSQVA